jgi:hypothetical protein
LVKTVEKEITEKIFTKSDVLTFIELIKQVYSESTFPSKKYSILLDCAGGESHNFESEFDKEDLFDSKKIYRISMRFTSYSSDHSISINLSQGARYSHSSYSVSGFDDWVDLWISKIEQRLVPVKPQNTYFKTNLSLIHTVISFFIGSILFYSLAPLFGFDVFNTSFNIGSSNDIFLSIILRIAISWLIGVWASLFFWFNMKEYILSLWPSTEFDFGPSHFKEYVVRRNVISAFVTAIIIPVLLQLLFLIF